MQQTKIPAGEKPAKIPTPAGGAPTFPKRSPCKPFNSGGELPGKI